MPNRKEDKWSRDFNSLGKLPAVNSWTGLSLSSSKHHKSTNIQRTENYLVHF